MKDAAAKAPGAIRDAAAKAPAKVKRVVRKAAAKVDKAATPKVRKRVMIGAVAAVAGVVAGIVSLDNARKAKATKPRVTPATPPPTSTAPHTS